jgi:prepilin-type N-terminal cleavage/methylation domain-containing protein
MDKTELDRFLLRSTLGRDHEAERVGTEMSLLLGERHLRREVRGHVFRGRGFSLIELLIGMTILAVGLLSIATMFPTGYSDVTGGGKTTMAAATARQILEDMHTIPFGNLGDLNGLDTSVANSLNAVAPVDATKDPGRTIARNIATRWMATFAATGATGQISVTSPSATLRQITVTVRFPRGISNVGMLQGPLNLRLATIISSL